VRREQLQQVAAHLLDVRHEMRARLFGLAPTAQREQFVVFFACAGHRILAVQSAGA